jgi:hypothetical protein
MEAEAMTWTNFVTAAAVAVTCLALMNHREEANKTRYTVACSTKSDSARAFMKGMSEGLR